MRPLGNRSLEKLDLRDNLIGEAGVQKIEELLASNNTLMEVDLSENHISEARLTGISKVVPSRPGSAPVLTSILWRQQSGRRLCR